MSRPMSYRITHPPFTPVRPWRIEPPSRPSPTLGALAALGQLSAREAELRRANLRRLRGGVGVVLLVTAASLLPVAWWASAARRVPPPPAWAVADRSAPVPLTRRPPAELSRGVVAIDGVLAMAMLPVAVLTRRTSRADVAGRILHEGCKPHGGHGNPLVRAVLVVIAVGMLYGEFLILDAAKTAWVAGRVRGVDRHRVALMLAMLRADPTGLDPRLLLRAGERPADLRRPIAYLVVHEWADVARGGDRLVLLSTAGRALRH